MVVLVTGGRKYRNRAFVWYVLDFLAARRRITKLVEGGATGTDTHAREWAIARGIDPTTCDADWTAYGNHAGRMRNVQMLREHRPDIVIAFPGHTGTIHMIGIAKQAGIPVLPAARHERSFNGSNG